MEENDPIAETPPAQQQLVPFTVDNYLEIAIGCALRGAMAGIQNVSPADIAVSASRALAVNIGVVFHGDLATVLTIRKQCREAFAAKLADAPPPPPAPLSEMVVANGKGH